MKILYKNKYWEINKDYDINKILYLLIDRPNRITSYNEFFWKNKKNQLHRDYDFPVVVHCDGYISWCENDKLHRENNKPAVICNDGSREYWINSNYIKTNLTK